MQKEEKKESLLKRAGLNKETHLSVQDTIPYVEMARDGICKVSEGVYSKTVKFFDINYQLARDDDKLYLKSGVNFSTILIVQSIFSFRL